MGYKTIVEYLTSLCCDFSILILPNWFLFVSENIFAGTVAGVYAGVEYGVKRIREERDWVI